MNGLEEVPSSPGLTQDGDKSFSSHFSDAYAVFIFSFYFVAFGFHTLSYKLGHLPSDYSQFISCQKSLFIVDANLIYDPGMTASLISAVNFLRLLCRKIVQKQGKSHLLACIFLVSQYITWIKPRHRWVYIYA